MGASGIKNRRRVLLCGVILAAACPIAGCYTAAGIRKGAPQSQGLVISPVEGHVLKIIRNISASTCDPFEIHCHDKHVSVGEFKPFLEDNMSLVVIFMKIYHKHITVSPIEGTILKTHYVPGGFRNVFSKNAYRENEHNGIIIDGDIRLGVFQIAGLVARTIICDVKEGDRVLRGDKLGHIRLGSAVALLLPAECTIVVREGDKVEVGKAIIATYGDTSGVTQ
jgi:phosphatidylserine decarboxylase precursor-related protein